MYWKVPGQTKKEMIFLVFFFRKWKLEKLSAKCIKLTGEHVDEHIHFLLQSYSLFSQAENFSAPTHIYIDNSVIDNK